MKKKSKFNFRTIHDLSLYLGVREDSLQKYANGHFYTAKKSVSKRGKERLFFNPSNEYKQLLKKINQTIFARVPLPPSFKGGVKGGSSATNAKVHCGKKFILNVDIKNFFPSITEDHILKFLYSIGFYKEPAEVMKNLIMVKYPHKHLPQGFPTSSLVAAHVLRIFDKKMYQLGKFYNWTHTIYVDDITVSSDFSLKRHLPRIINLLAEEGFEISEKKTSVVDSSEQMLVTSVVVNKKANLPQQKRNLLFGYLRQIKKYGVRKFLVSKGVPPTKENVLKLQQRIEGKISYVMGINRELGLKYRKEVAMINWV